MSDRRSLSDAELRDWFAGQALAGFATAIAGTPINESPLWHKMAEDAYEAADAMLAARKDAPDEH